MTQISQPNNAREQSADQNVTEQQGPEQTSAWTVSLPVLRPSWVMEPKRDISEVCSSYEPENYVKLKGAEVMVADYELLKSDFPALADMSPEQIDEWLMRQVAAISEMQIAPNDVNTPIPVATNPDGSYDTLPGFRPLEPHFYGRAAVFPVEGGLIDVKGSGAFIPPAQTEKLSGLLPLSEGLREYAMEKVTSMAAMKTALHPEEGSMPFSTVGSYAVIKLPFNIRYADGTEAPACLYLRQAHDRAKIDEFPTGKQIMLENTLRQFGLTATEYRSDSDGIYGGGSLGSYDRINIQTTKDTGNGMHGVYDYGSIRVRHDLNRPVMLDDGMADQGVIRSSPLPHLALSESVWSGSPDPLFDNLSARFHFISIGLQNGTLTRRDIENDMAGLLDNARDTLWKA